jgi:tetratricopeptide (TPR) repeat protein
MNVFEEVAADLTGLSLLLWERGAIDEMYDPAIRALDLVLEHDAPSSVTEIVSYIGTATVLGTTACEDAMTTMRSLGERVRDHRSAYAICMVDVARLEAMLEHHEDASMHLDEATAILEDLGQAGWVAETDLAAAEIARWRGDARSAVHSARAAYDRFAQHGDTLNTVLAARHLARMLMLAGQPDEAELRAREVLAGLGSYDVELQAESRSILATCLVGRSPAEARRLADEAESLVASTGFLNLRAEIAADLAEILKAVTGDTQEAAEAAADARALFERKGNAAGPRTRGL